MQNITTRRELLLVASLGGVAAAAGIMGASAQESFRLDAKRDFHTRILLDSLNAHDNLAALSRDGMNRSLNRLVSQGIVNEAESNSLGVIVSSLFDDDNLDQLYGHVSSIIQGGANILSDAAESIAAVAQSSVEVALQRLNDVDYQIAQTAIAHDIKGALEGAVSGAALASLVPAPGFSTTVGAAAGALIGAGTSSFIGYASQ